MAAAEEAAFCDSTRCFVLGFSWSQLLLAFYADYQKLINDLSDTNQQSKLSVSEFIFIKNNYKIDNITWSFAGFIWASLIFNGRKRLNLRNSKKNANAVQWLEDFKSRQQWYIYRKNGIRAFCVIYPYQSKESGWLIRSKITLLKKNGAAWVKLYDKKGLK